MTLKDHALWKEILLKALSDGKGEQSPAVPGSKLRTLIQNAALRRGLEFPPPEFANKKFGKFLAYFQRVGCIVVREREGQDVLVAPSSEPERLVEAPGGDIQATGLRHDLFSAFSTVTPQKAVYIPSQDKFVWVKEDEEIPDDAVLTPQVTFEGLTNDRRDFASQLTDTAKRDALFEALSQPRSLPAFTAAVTQLRLQSEWHWFRLRRVLDRVSDWANQHNIQFQAAWITNSKNGRANESSDGGGAALASRNLVPQALSLLERLGEEDLARISVPLDLVVKLFTNKR